VDWKEIAEMGRNTENTSWHMCGMLRSESIYLNCWDK
jgi:hypothetical protein